MLPPQTQDSSHQVTVYSHYYARHDKQITISEIYLPAHLSSEIIMSLCASYPREFITSHICFNPGLSEDQTTGITPVGKNLVRDFGTEIRCVKSRILIIWADVIQNYALFLGQKFFDLLFKGVGYMYGGLQKIKKRGEHSLSLPMIITRADVFVFSIFFKIWMGLELLKF